MKVILKKGSLYVDKNNDVFVARTDEIIKISNTDTENIIFDMCGLTFTTHVDSIERIYV